jgi:sec-independent protein translocase protein TatA
MLGRMFEGWHLIVLLVVVLVLFGGKRLPDAARGLGRSLRIFKSEVRQMNEESGPGSPTGTNPAPPATPDALEGRLVEGEPERSPRPTEQRRDS